MSIEFIKKLTDIVEANLANEKFGVEDLIREIGMTHSSLHRKLKSISNQTISQFIREIRLKKAKELLLNADLTVSEISYRVGFGSPTYFNKCFHEYFSYAPGELKNRELNHEAEEQPVDAFPIKSKRRKILLALIISLITLIPLTIFLIDKATRAKATNAKEKSIAILPFKSLSSDPEKQYLADGVMDAILLHLSKIKDLQVKSRTSVEQYRKTDKTVKVIGKELEVAYLLEGSFLRDGDKARLIVQLIRTRDEDHVWSNEYDRDWKDILSVQSEIAETIASELKAVITTDEKQLIRKLPTTNLLAYDFYQRGRNEYMKYENDNSNKTALVNAWNLFQKALEQDSTFAKAYTGLAEIMWDKNVQIPMYKNQYLENFTDSILILANRAIDYDNQLAEAYSIRGNCYLETGKIEQASEEFDKAIQLDPNDWESHYNKGRIYHYLYENFAEGITNYIEALKRIRGKEYPYILMSIGHAYQWAGFFDQTKQYYADVLSLLGDSAWYFSNLSFIELSKENLVNALMYAKKANAINSNYIIDLGINCSSLSNHKEIYQYYQKYIEATTKSEYIPTVGAHRIGFCYWKLGNLKEANYYFDQQIKYSQEMIKLHRFFSDSHPYYDLAATYAFIGNKAEAYKNLDLLKKRKSFAHWWTFYLKNDPLFDNIRKEARFQQIVSEIESKYLAEHERTKKLLEEAGILVAQKNLGMHITP